MSLKMQAKVLRVLQDQTFQPVGGTRTIRVNVRLIAATNKRIEEEIEGGSFRQDLYFRLNVIPIHVAPLRERRADIPLLVDHFCREVAREYGRRPKQFTVDAMEVLRGYPWPGNVRELKNVVERVMIMVPSETVQPSDLHSIVKGREGGRGADVFSEFDSLREARESFERQFIQRKLEENGWNITRTAEVLGLERSNLHRKLKAYGLGSERGSAD
jgi:two-component system nitrogen regulation response regulator NtrX